MFVKNNSKSVTNVGGLMVLRPGNNEVDAKAWKEATKIAEIQDMIKAKRLEVVSGGAAESSGQQEEPADDAPQSLSDMNAPEAAALVAETNDPDTLERWMKDEQRVTVKKAIEAQLEKLSTEDEP